MEEAEDCWGAWEVVMFDSIIQDPGENLALVNCGTRFVKYKRAGNRMCRIQRCVTKMCDNSVKKLHNTSSRKSGGWKSAETQ